MTYIFITIFALIIASLSLGPASHAAIQGYSVPNLVVVTIWAFVWLTSVQLSYRYAIVIGLLFDAVSFLPFGFWTVLAVLITLIATQLKNRVFELSSVFQALLVLGVVLLVWELVTALVSGQLFVSQSLFSVIYSLVLGSIVYYVFAVRYKLLQRWLGRRL